MEHRSSEKSLKEPETCLDQVDRDVDTVVNADIVVKVGQLHGNLYVNKDPLVKDEVENLVDKDYKNFLNSLAEEAKREYGARKRVLNSIKPLEIAPLQITKHTERHRLDEIDHYHHRPELVQLLNEPPEGDISYKDLFTKAKNYAESEVNFSLTREARQNELAVIGNIVAVSGQAGIGKTTLTKIVLQEAIERGLYDAIVIFYLQFRNIDCIKETNLLLLLAKHLTFAWITDKQRRNAVLEKLLTKSENVLIIMDGLDEANVDWHSIKNTEINPYESGKAGVFIANLLNGKIMKKSKKLLTSRPRQLSELPDNLHPSFSVKIIGLNEDAQRKFCREICESKTYSDKVFDHILDHPDLSSYCFVPVNCILVVHCVNQIMKQGEKSSIPLPTSMTMVLIVVLVYFIKTDQMRKKDLETEKLAKLAWQGFSLKKLSFNEDELNEADLDKNSLNTFLITVRGESDLPLLSGTFESVSYFSHLLLQEFFVAMNLNFFIQFKEFNSLFFENESGQTKFDLSESRFEMVLKFLFGLCNTTTVKYLQKGISKCVFPTQQAKKLKDLLRQNLNDLDLSKEKRFETILRICSLAYEMQCDDFTKEVSSCLSDQLTVQGDIVPSDVAGLYYVLKARRDLLTMVITNDAHYVGDGFMRFLKEMKKTSDFSNVLIKEFNMKRKTIEEAEAINLSSYLKRIQELRLYACKVSRFGITVIGKEIEKLVEPIKRLDFFTTKIGDEGAICLSSCLKNIRELRFYKSDVTKKGIEEMAAKIKLLDKPMIQFDPSGNDIGDDGAYFLSFCLENIKELYLIQCNITEKGIKNLSEAIADLKTPIEKLDLSKNKVNDAGISQLCICLHNIKRLYLEKSSLTQEGFEKFADALVNLPNPMEEIGFSRNNLEKGKAIPLARGLHNVKTLHLEVCKFSHATPEAFAKTISAMNVPIEHLNLMGNSIGDKGAKFLSSCLFNLEELCLQNNKISCRGCEEICSKVGVLQKSMKLLDLSLNEIGHVDGLGNLARNVEKLCLSDCKLTHREVEILSQNVGKLQKMKFLDLSKNKIGDEGFEKILSCIRQIEKLHIGDSKDELLTIQGITKFSSALQSLITPMEELIVWCPPEIFNRAKTEMQKCRRNVKQLQCKQIKF